LLDRDDVWAFTEDDITLVQTFGAQVVIAIENMRQFSEVDRAFSHQTATADALRTISASPDGTQPVFDEIVRLTTTLIDCDLAIVGLTDGDVFWQAAVATKDGVERDFNQDRHDVEPEMNLPSQVLFTKKTGPYRRRLPSRFATARLRDL